MSRSKGDELEKYLLKLLRDAGLHGSPTVNSGATHDDGDIKVDGFIIECKVQEVTDGRIRKNITINQDTFDKVAEQSRKQLKSPVLAVANGFDDRYAVLKLSDFVKLLARLKDAEEELRNNYGEES